MERFIHLLKGKRIVYTLGVSMLMTILVVATFVDFAERILNNKWLALSALAIFYCFSIIILREEMWKNDQPEN